MVVGVCSDLKRQGEHVGWSNAAAGTPPPSPPQQQPAPPPTPTHPTHPPKAKAHGVRSERAPFGCLASPHPFGSLPGPERTGAAWALGELSRGPAAAAALHLTDGITDGGADLGSLRSRGTGTGTGTGTGRGVRSGAPPGPRGPTLGLARAAVRGERTPAGAPPGPLRPRCANGAAAWRTAGRRRATPCRPQVQVARGGREPVCRQHYSQQVQAHAGGRVDGRAAGVARRLVRGAEEQGARALCPGGGGLTLPSPFGARVRLDAPGRTHRQDTGAPARGAAVPRS